MQAPHNFNQIKNWSLGAVAVASLVFTVIDWSSLHPIKIRLAEIAFLSTALAATELCFIGGAVLMMIAVGEQLPGIHWRSWANHMLRAKRDVRIIAAKAIRSRTFGVGFWLNFFGAVGTSSILLFGIFYTLPLQAWGVALIVVIDLIATFAWRIPLQLMRVKSSA